jgi:hypothetical protein
LGHEQYSPTTPALPSDYEFNAKQLAAKQVVLAGYRLADELNQAVAPTPAAPVRTPVPSH